MGGINDFVTRVQKPCHAEVRCVFFKFRDVICGRPLTNDKDDGFSVGQGYPFTVGRGPLEGRVPQGGPVPGRQVVRPDIWIDSG